MKIGVFGAGYVGLVTGTCLAEMGNHVTIADISEEKIACLREGKSPHFEPGLDEILTHNIEEKRLCFTADPVNAVVGQEAIFLAVGTPMSDDGSANLTYIRDAALMIARTMDAYRTIIIKSTVPVGTNAALTQIIAENTTHDFSVVSNPEFLKEGAAVNDFMKPDRIVIGVRDERAEKTMQRIYSPFVRTGRPVMRMDPESAEMVKYASNALLASRISFMNEMAGICDKVGADIELVRKGVGSDGRIGGAFLFPGLGYGGSCFPKDVRALSFVGQSLGVRCPICDAVDEVNVRQRLALLPVMAEVLGEDLSGKKVAVWGLAFKPRTDDVREAPALYMIEELRRRGAAVTVYDPEAMHTARRELGDTVEYATGAYDALTGADALLICTEWNDFRTPDFSRIRSLLKAPLIFDGRNLYDREVVAEAGFRYYSIGRPPVIA